MDERQATSALRQALTLHPAEHVLISVIEPLMTWIGKEWQAGRLSVGVEHFVSALIVRELVLLLTTAPEPWRTARVLAACVPGDQHEIGLLALSVGLRRRGWDVCYLGANLPLKDLAQAAASLRPEVILISATHRLGEPMLSALVDLSRRLPGPPPHLVIGGRAIRGTDGVSGDVTLLHARLDDALAALETVLLQRSHAR
jgi:methanogenic corrinoid protein MtbC1